MIAQLDFFVDVVNEPWGGRSPRGLTRVALGLIFKAGALEQHERFGFHPDQLGLFDEPDPQLPTYRGASTLLPLLGG